LVTDFLFKWLIIWEFVLLSSLNTLCFIINTFPFASYFLRMKQVLKFRFPWSRINLSSVFAFSFRIYLVIPEQSIILWSCNICIS
jgi:hypothetical protein